MIPPPDKPREEETLAALRRAPEEATQRDSPAEVPVLSDTPAVVVPDHELIICIGRGSYGEVWLARNVMGTYRAVKVVERASFENSRPFEREFNGILKFEPLSRSHPGLVDILQVGRTEQCFYYVMELADDVGTGQLIDPLHYLPKTLRAELDAQGHLSFEHCLRLALALTEALGHLHSHGLIHRDIKPSNIIFVHDLPKLADIGLVADQKDAKSFVGTEGFIPPEGPGTAQADLYSLGKVLYELATGKDRHQFPELPTLLDENATAEAGLLELNAVILKACDPDLKRRYQSATALRDDLLLLQSGKSVKRSQALERRLARARRVAVVALGLILLTVSAVLFFRGQARREAILRGRAEAGEFAARRNLYVADLHLAARALEENNRGRAIARLSRYLPENTGLTQDLRGWEWRMLWQRARSEELFTLGRHSNAVAALALSRDGKTLYSASRDRTVGIWDLASRRQTAALVDGALLSDLDLSPDGQLLATCNWAQVLRVWDLTTRTVQFVRTNAEPLGFVRFTPDGRQLVYRDTAGVWLWDPVNGGRTELLRRPSVEIGHISTAAFSPDGRRFAFSAGDDEIHLLDWEHRVDLGTFPATNSSSFDHKKLGLVFSPDSRMLAAAGFDGVQVWDVATRRFIWHVERTGNEDWNANPAFSPDGRLLVTVTSDQRIQLRDTTTWAEVTTLRGHEFVVWAVRFTPDGLRLITAAKDRTIRVWPVPVRTPVPSETNLGFAQPSESFAWNWDPSLGRRTDFFPTPPRWWWWALSNDGGQVLKLEETGRWVVSALETSRPGLAGVLPSLKGLRVMAVSDDGQAVAFMWEDELVVFGGTKADQPLVRLPEGISITGSSLNVLMFAPKGRQLLWANEQGAVRWLDVTTGTIETVVAPLGQKVISLTLASGGGRFAVGYSEGLVVWKEFAKPEIHRINTGHSDHVSSLAFSPDEQVLATGGWDPTIKFWNLKKGELQDELGGTLRGYPALQFSADGRRFAAGSSDGQISVWDLESSPPSEIVTWRAHGSLEHPSIIDPLRFRPDGSLVSLSFDGIRLWWAPPLEEIDRVRRSQ